MSSRPLMIAGLLGATVGVPYIASRLPGNDNAANVASPSATSDSAMFAPTGQTQPITTQTPNPLSPAGAATHGAARSPTVDQALRFDVTKEWVYRHWERKSTGPTDVGLFAVRVPLVSGTQRASLAGSLTYYFNAHDQVEHISFRGRTGDPARLIRFIMQVYELQPVAAPPGEQLYQTKKRGRVQSELRTRPEPVLSSTSPHNSFAVELELARPGSKRFLPPRVPQLAIPEPAAPTQPDAATTASAGETANMGKADAPTGTFLDRFRHATPKEEDQVLWKRWPN